jgi:hypothetical protein
MRSVVITATVLFAGLSVLAQDGQPPPADAPTSSEATTLHNYGSVEKTCRRWTDGCRTCARQADAEPVCSNIGIACQPAAITCTSREPAAAPN